MSALGLELVEKFSVRFCRVRRHISEGREL